MVDIVPNGTDLPGIDQLRIIVGAVMTVGLILSVLALLIAAIVWGFGANSSNPHLASRGKVGVLVACGAAIVCGSAVTLVNLCFVNLNPAISALRNLPVQHRFRPVEHRGPSGRFMGSVRRRELGSRALRRIGRRQVRGRPGQSRAIS